MAFTGYNFSSPSAILPYLETPHVGPTSSFCRELAQRLHCHVVAGYPESLDERTPSSATVGRFGATSGCSSDSGSSYSAETDDDWLVGANSAMVYSPDGRLVLNYRKTNLYESDITWAVPGSGFATFDLPIGDRQRDRAPSPSGTPENDESNEATTAMPEAGDSSSSTDPAHRHSGLKSPRHVCVALGICMDLNPAVQHPSPSPSGPISSTRRRRTRIWVPNSWSSANGPYELADYCVRHEADLLVMANAWLDSGVVESSGSEESQSMDRDEPEADFHTLNYWANRLRPMWVSQRLKAEEPQGDSTVDSASLSNSQAERITKRARIVMCNRIGEEKGEWLVFFTTPSIFISLDSVAP